MAKAQLSSENMEFLLEMVKRFQLDKKVKRESMEEVAVKMLNSGDSVEHIIDVTELSREEVLRLIEQNGRKEK